MTTETYLKQLNKLNDKIDGSIAQIEMLYGRAMDISIKVKDVDVQTSRNGDSMERAVVKIADLKSYLLRTFSEEIDLRRKILYQVNQIEDDRHYMILSKRYLQNKSWGEIETETGLSYHHLMKIKKSALAEFESKFGNTYKIESESRRIIDAYVV